MNPFEVFNIEIQLNPDLKELRKKYILLQQNSHIDLGGNEQDSEEINRAYEILKDKENRVTFIINNVLNINLKDHPLSPEFLMDMMEINDLISDSTTRNQAEDVLSEIDSDLNLEFQNIDNELKVKGFEDNGIQLKIVDWFQRFKYFVRLRKNLQGIEEL